MPPYIEVITDPGKFEGQPKVAPTLWNLANQGFADEEWEDVDGTLYSQWDFTKSSAEDVADALFSSRSMGDLHNWEYATAYEFSGNYVSIWEDAQGFVSVDWVHESPHGLGYLPTESGPWA